MNKGILFFVFAFALAIPAVANQEDRLCKGFLPENSMRIPVHEGPAANMAKAKFDEVLDRIEQVYTPIISQMGGTLKVDRKWTDPTVNAYADREGRTWKIVMFGGFARHPAVTSDGFMAVACHELGHHIGGAPKYGGDWASIEGESDYFANLKCLRRVFDQDDNKKIVDGMTVDPIAVRNCKAEHNSQQDEYVCIRATMAAISLSKVLAEDDPNSPAPQLDTPDKTEVTQTNGDHPRGQCRLDTLFEASLCKVPFAQDVSQSDFHTGSCYTPNHARGARSRCWFKPN